MKTNKKGSFDDMFILIIFAFVLGTSILVGALLLNKVNDMYQTQDFIPTAAKESIQDSTDNYSPLFDGFFITIFFSMAIASIILASQVDVSPIFFPLSIIIYVVLIVISAIFGNLYYDLAATQGITEYAEGFSLLPFIFNNLVAVMLGIGFLLGVVLYAKTTG